MENATRDHCPSHGWLAAPKEKMRRAPSSRMAAARELSREYVRRPLLDVTSSSLSAEEHMIGTLLAGNRQLVATAERITMSRRTSPPFRADHVGSLLRPRRLLQARDDFAVGRITAADLRAAEDEEIIGAIRRQEEIGLQSATDGEFRRASWHMDFIYALGGISKAPGNMAVKFNNPSGNIVWTPAALHIGGRVKLEHPIFGEDFSFVRSHVT